MAGMEVIEIHSKSYLVRWVNVKSETTISWSVQPHKKSINFGVFKHPGYIAGLAPSLPPVIGHLPPSPNPDTSDGSEKSTMGKEVASTVVEKLTGLGMKQVYWAGRFEADKIAQGCYDVPGSESGNYALVFDNTFSKNISKTATLFLLTYPTKCQPQILFGAQLHHSQAMATALSAAPSQKARFSPKLRARRHDSNETLKNTSANNAFDVAIPAVPEIPTLTETSAGVVTGVLQKRRRKKRQGSARRFFSLDFTTSTLSYYYNRNSSALRGSIPLSLAVIGANAKTREISIDSGAEIWHLRATNKSDFDHWKRALEKASRLMAERKPSTNGVHIDTQYPTPISTTRDVDWTKLEALINRLEDTRDSIKRLCAEVETKSMPPPSPGPASGPSTPTDATEDDYFKVDGKRPFWKRKPSGISSQTSFGKRSISAQLTIPLASAVPLPIRSPQPGVIHTHENWLQDRSAGLLHHMDSIVNDFSSMVAQHNSSNATFPESAASRLSMHSVESQEFFDAEDGRRSAFFEIKHDSDDEDRSEDEHMIEDADSATSSEIDERNDYAQPRRKFRMRAGSIASILPPRAHSLQPLPLAPVQRRVSIRAPKIMPPSLIGFLRKNMGKDLSTISMPVSANEPLSLLQRAAEQLEYSDLLDRAAQATDAVEERSIRKPFNPMLGETYELVREDRGFRLISEKVSHRPVQLAFLAESSEWCFTQSPIPSQKFWGKSSEIITEGKARVLLHQSGECLSWSAPTCFLRNIIAGEKYVEPEGKMTILNETTGHNAVVTFKAKGMWSGRSEDLDVQTFDAHGAELPLGLQGTWTHSVLLKEHSHLTKTAMWSAGSLVEQAAKHYGMTSFAVGLNEITSVEANKLPPTDSRLRPDQRALEDGEHDQAEHLKNQLEDKQRSRRKDMEAKGESWRPRWFTKIDNGNEVLWKLKAGKDGYWEERATGEWTGVVPVLSS